MRKLNNIVIENIIPFGWNYVDEKKDVLLFTKNTCSSTTYKLFYNKSNNLITIHNYFYDMFFQQAFRGKISQIEDIRHITRMVVL